MPLRPWFGVVLCVVAGPLLAQSPDYFVVNGNPTTAHSPVSWAQCPPGHALRSGGFHTDDISAVPEESDLYNAPPHQNSWRVKSKSPGTAYVVCNAASGPQSVYRSTRKP